MSITVSAVSSPFLGRVQHESEVMFAQKAKSWINSPEEMRNGMLRALTLAKKKVCGRSFMVRMNLIVISIFLK